MPLLKEEIFLSSEEVLQILPGLSKSRLKEWRKNSRNGSAFEECGPPFISLSGGERGPFVYPSSEFFKWAKKVTSK